MLTPGPTNVHYRVLQTLARPQIGHLSDEMREAFIESLDLSAYLFGGGKPIVLSGSGTIAMESSSMSLIDPGDKVLVLVNGYFGMRFAEIAKLHGADVKEISLENGKPALPDIVGEELAKENYKAIFMTHVETSNGLENPIADIVSEAKKKGVISVVDSVCGIGGCKFNFEEIEADIAFTGSQKAVGGIPGASLLSISSIGLEALQSKKTPIRSYYLNLLRWNKVMDNPKRYLSTPSTQVLIALKEALLMVKEEGLEKRWIRHQMVADALRSGIMSLGLDLVAEEGYRANTVSAFYTPVDSAKIVATMKDRFGITISTGIGEGKERMLRIGHMANISPNDVISCLSALEISLKLHDVDVKRGAALDSAAEIFEKNAT